MIKAVARALCAAVAAMIALGSVIVHRIAPGRRSIRPKRKAALA